MKTPLVTREGYEKLRKEHDYLWNKRRPEIVKIVAWAAALGDRSENADYTYNKRLLRQIDRRVRYLRQRLLALKIVDYSSEQEGRVFFGAWVKIEKINAENSPIDVMFFRIVGSDEIYGGEKNSVSIDSPMALALISKKPGDEVKVTTPGGEQIWRVLSVNYSSSLK